MIEKAIFTKEWLTFSNREDKKDTSVKGPYSIYNFNDGINIVFFEANTLIERTILEQEKKYFVSYKKLKVGDKRFRGILPRFFLEKS